MRFVRTAESIFDIPSNFTRVEYLQSTGTQYIDTGYIPTNSTGMKLSWTRADNNDRAVMGTRNSSAGDTRFFIGAYSQGMYISWNTLYVVPTTTQINTFYETSMNYKNDRKRFLDGTELSQITETLASINQSIYLFWIPSAANKARSKIKYAQITEGSELVRYFIPCIDPLGVPCMYDLVGKKPYYNAGTGTFSVGRQVIPVNYLESTGTQYVDTNTEITSTTTILIDASLENYSQWSNSCGGVPSARGYFCLPFGWTDSNTKARSIYGTDTAGTGEYDFNYTLGKRVKILYNDNKKLYIDDVHVFTFNYDKQTPPSTQIFQFGRYSNACGAKFYGVKIWDNGYNSTLVADYIPCKDENNIGFMFDTLSGTVYLNEGTGAFSVGENKYTSKLRLIKEAKELPDGYKRVEYLESDSTAYIDTGVSGANNNLKIEMGFSYSKFYAYGYFFSNYESEQHNTTRFLLDASNNSRGLAYINTKSQDGAIYNSNVTKDSFHTFVLTKTSLTIDGVTTTNNNPPVGTANTKNIILFNRGAGSYANTRDIGMRCYYFRIYDNDVLVRDLIPVLDNSGIPAMYDRINGGTYYNEGTGSFTYGHTITPVEYLESTGTQYIDTGIKLNNNSSVELDYQLTQATQSRTGLFGALNLTGSNQGRFGSLLSPSNQQLEHGYGSGNDYWQQGLPDTNIHKLYQKKNEVYFDGTLIHTFSSATFSLAINAPLGNFNFTNYNPASAKYYRSKWWDNGTLVRSFIPVRDENNVGYMFDKVTGQLFGNAGSGSFVVGNDLRKPKVRFIQDVIPSAYIPLNYIQSTGTQYIDTGVYPTQLTEVEYRCAVTGSVANVDSHLFGSRLSASSEAFDLAYMNTTPNGIEKFRFVHGTITTQETTTSVTATQLKNPHTYYMSGTSFKVDGVEKMSFTTTSFTGTYSLWLFGVNNAGSLHNQVRAQRVYKCIIWDNGVLVRDLYPALRKSDNKPGMYDRITKQFFVNQGTGEFNYEI